MSSDWAPGPGMESRGDSAPSGSSSFKGRRRQVEERASAPGVSKTAPLRTAKKAGPTQKLYDHWMERMVKAAFRKQCSVVEPRPVFSSNVKYLRETRGLTDEEITNLIDQFAEAVEGGRISVSQKSAWRVFMKTWHTLGGTAAQRGLRARMEADDDTDWTSR